MNDYNNDNDNNNDTDTDSDNDKNKNTNNKNNNDIEFEQVGVTDVSSFGVSVSIESFPQGEPARNWLGTYVRPLKRSAEICSFNLTVRQYFLIKILLL